MENENLKTKCLICKIEANGQPREASLARVGQFADAED